MATLTGKTLGSYTLSVATETNTVTEITTTNVVESPIDLIDPTITDISAPAVTYSLIDPNLLVIATNVAESNTLQEGLGLISYNPIANLINVAKNTLYYYTENSYANLDLALASVAADSLVATQYAYLKDAIGGGDGLSGAIAQLDSFKEHTDRISGLKLESENEFAEQTDDTVSEQFFYYNLPVGTPTIVGSFNAKNYRSAKYLVQATSASEHQLTDFMVIHDNHLAYARVINDVQTTDPFVTYSGVLSAGKINIYANTTLANTDLVVYGTKIQIAKDSSSPERMSQFKILDSHRILTTYYNDGTDYVALQTSSLQKQNTIAELAREVSDSVAQLQSSAYSTLSTTNRQNFILAIAAAINNKSQSLQDSIDADYQQYQLAEKKAEALRILNQLSANYTDPLAKTLIDQTTLDSVKGYL